MIRLYWLTALAVCFLSIGICFVIEPMHVRSPHRRSPVTMAASSRRSPEDSNHHHSFAPMEISRRGFLMSSLASIVFLPSALLAANSPPDVSDTISDGANLKRNNSTHTTTTRPTTTGPAASKRYYGHETHHEGGDHKAGGKRPKVQVKPTNGKSKGNLTPPRIKGLARNELFLKISEVLV